MAQYNETNARTELVGSGGVTKYCRVKLDSNLAVIAGATDEAWIGVALEDAGEGDYVAVLRKGMTSTFPGIADAGIAAGALLDCAANGEFVTDAAGTSAHCVARTAASNAGEYIEVEYIPEST